MPGVALLTFKLVNSAPESVNVFVVIYVAESMLIQRLCGGGGAEALQPSGAAIGAADWEAMGVYLEAIGAYLEAIGVYLEAIGVDLGAIGAYFEAIGAYFEAIGAYSGRLEPNWRRLKPFFEAIGAYFEAIGA